MNTSGASCQGFIGLTLKLNIKNLNKARSASQPMISPHYYLILLTTVSTGVQRLARCETFLDKCVKHDT